MAAYHSLTEEPITALHSAHKTCAKRPFPSYLVPLFQNESTSVKRFIWKWVLRGVWFSCESNSFSLVRMVLLLDSFWDRGTRELGNGPFHVLLCITQLCWLNGTNKLSHWPSFWGERVKGLASYSGGSSNTHHPTLLKLAVWATFGQVQSRTMIRDRLLFVWYGSVWRLIHCSSYLNIVHIPDKPGQSHTTQEFEKTLNEVMN